VPAIYGNSSRDIIKAQIFVSRNLGEHYDLTGVHREMLGHVKDCVENSYVPALNQSLFQNRSCIEILQNLVDFKKCCLEKRKKSRTGDYFSAGKLGLPSAVIASVTDTRNDPLA
jgi:hypothetical protein